MGLFDGILGGGGGGDAATPQLLEPQWQTDLRELLAGAAEPGAFQRLFGAGQEFPISPLGEMELGGLDALQQFLESPLPTEGSLFQSAVGEVQSTLDGEYDPYQGEYWQAYKGNVMRELQEATDRVKAQRSGREGGIFGGGMTNVLGELEETAVGGLQEWLGAAQERERERRLGAVPLAAQLTAYGEAAPAQRAAIALDPSLGGFMRTYNERDRAERMRAFQDLGLPLDVATGMSTYQPNYYYPAYQQGGQSADMMGGIGSILGGMDFSGGWLGGEGGGGGGLLGDWSPTGSTSQDMQLALMAATMFSDKRLKENIKPIKNAVNKVKELSGYTYNYKYNPPKNRNGGVMAQDLEKVLPDAVTEVDGIKMVRYDAVIGLLIEAVKELAA